MAILMLTLLIAFAAATAIVLADSGLRMWSAVAGIKAQHRAVMGLSTQVPQVRARHAVRMTTRVSYARPAPAGVLRAAA